MTTERKRYMLFASDFYYPRGGESDAQGMFDTVDAAQAKVDEMTYDWAELLDMDTGQWIDLKE